MTLLRRLLAAEGWTRWSVKTPPPTALCRFERADTGQVWTGRACEQAGLNVALVLWKLTGIAREKGRAG